MYRNETNFTFQRNPPRLQSTGSSVSQVFLIPSEKKFFGYVFNQFCTAPIFRANRHCRWNLGASLQPESKAQSMAWKHPTSPVDKKFKSQPSAGKIMLTLFWDMESAILVHFTPKGGAVNIAHRITSEK
jgi:hypothetical protein